MNYWKKTLNLLKDYMNIVVSYMIIRKYLAILVKKYLVIIF